MWFTTFGELKIGKPEAVVFLHMNGKNIITGMDIQKNVLSCQLYPNPFTNRADIVLSGLSQGSDNQLKLFDYLGKEVKSQSVENGRNQLDRGNLANGMYFLEILEKETVRVKMKVVIAD